MVTTMPDLVVNCFMSYLKEPKDRAVASLVCWRWHEIESLTRDDVTIRFCYATTPERLHRRYPYIKSLKIKGELGSFEVPEDWGGYANCWIQQMVSFKGLTTLYLYRMGVTDGDLEFLAHGVELSVLKLHFCFGFSTNGLFHITSSYRNLRTLFLEGSEINDFDGRWLNQLANNSKDLEELNCYMTKLEKFKVKDLELLARNCQSLSSVQVDRCSLANLSDFFPAATSLREFHGIAGEYQNVVFPTSLCQLSLSYLKNSEIDIIFPISASLKTLKLVDVRLNVEDHCLLIGGCPNLEALETTPQIGDRGLEALAAHCKNLRRLRIEDGKVQVVVSPVTQRGLIALSQGCLDLEHLFVYASDVTNASLESIGTHLKNLSHFGLQVKDGEEINFPLDNGIRALLRGCNQKLTRLDLVFAGAGAVTDVGLSYIGQYSPNVGRMLLCGVGETDEGLLAFSRGCPSLQELELVHYGYSVPALAVAATQLTALRYLAVAGVGSSNKDQMAHDLLAMAHPYWNIELIPSDNPVRDDDGKAIQAILAYYSLDGRRLDAPLSVTLLGP